MAIPQRQSLLDAAQQFLEQYVDEQGMSTGYLRQRLAQVRAEIEASGIYRHTAAELTFGARVAWRNAPECVGRFYWRLLRVRDMRHVVTTRQFYEALMEHIRLSTNGGKIQLTLTVFAPASADGVGPQVWNSQLARYAGHRLPDGSILGDPATTDFTDVAYALGWTPAHRTRFDILPLVLQMPYNDPQLFELPHGCVLEVPITHPTNEKIALLNLRWYSHPSISTLALEIGGVTYTAAPFSGWYTGAEIGARNFSDADRYNTLGKVAACFDLDTSSDRTLWKDRALLELNVAVLHSYSQAGVSIIDHHFASRHFVRHEQRECAAGRELPGAWEKLIPAISPSTVPIFHRQYHPTRLSPGLIPQCRPWTDALAQEGRIRNISLGARGINGGTEPH